MRSMTGFGQASAEGDRFAVTATLRSVNHRFLDLKIRLDDAYQESEAPLRKLLKGELFRGRVEVRLEVEALGESPVQVRAHREVLRTLSRTFDELREEGLVAGELRVGDVLRLPEAMQVKLEDGAWRAEDAELLLTAVRQALAQLVTARKTEGQQLQTVLGDRLDQLGALADELWQRRQEVVELLRGNLERRLQELLSTTALDAGRLEQEVAVLVDKTDVTEELDRLRSHLSHFRQVLDQKGSLGKRLDFLTQEIFRELNTLGAKCRDSDMIRQVLDAKVICEQLREQVQNVE